MIKLLIIGFIVLVIIAALVIIVRNKPDLWFWIFLNLYFDPGGYVTGFRDGKIFGPFTMKDAFILGIIFCLVSAKINWKVISQDQLLSKFILFLTFFTSYYFIIYGGVAPFIHQDLNYSTFLIKNREFIYGFFILLAVYLFALRTLNYFYSVTIFFGALCLSLYLITLLTGIELIYVWEFEREGTGMTRIAMLSYGLFDIVFPLSLIVYIISKKINLDIKYKNWLFYAGIIFLITQIITLTRRTQIDILGTVIITVIIIAYVFRTGKLASLLKLVVPTTLVIAILFFTFPNYIGYMAKTAEDTFLLITTGQDSEGHREYRVSGAESLEITKEYIRNNLLIGTGYSYLYWGPGYAYSIRGREYSLAMDAAGEVPIYYSLFGFGILGVLLMIPLYFIMLKLFYKLITELRSQLLNYLQDPMTIIFSIYILLTIATIFTINFYNLSSHFRGSALGYNTIFLGIGFALYNKIFLNSLLKNEGS